MEMTATEALSTTRAVRRRLDLDRPVEREVVDECLELALQAPAGSNRFRARFVIVSDPDKRAGIAEVYRESFAEYRTSGRYPTDETDVAPDRERTQQRVATSAEYLAEVMHRVPVLVVPCVLGSPPERFDLLAGYFGSVLPSVWSFMLAARTRGLGTCWTTMHLGRAHRVAELLDLPDEATQVALVPTAYTIGSEFKPAARPTFDAVAAWDRWPSTGDVDTSSDVTSGVTARV